MLTPVIPGYRWGWRAVFPDPRCIATKGARLPRKAKDTTTVYRVVNAASGGIVGTQPTLIAAKREADRLSREAHQQGHRHFGRPVEYVVETQSGIEVAA